MEEMKKVLKVAIMAVGLLCVIGMVISIIGDELATDIITLAILFFTGYGIVAFVKKVKEKG